MKDALMVKVLQTSESPFEGGSVKTARAQLTNPTPAQFTYDVELYLATDNAGINSIATSGSGPVTIPANGIVTTYFTLQIPVVAGEYRVFIKISVGGVHLSLYKANQNVHVAVTPAIEIGPIIWE